MVSRMVVTALSAAMACALGFAGCSDDDTSTVPTTTAGTGTAGGGATHAGGGGADTGGSGGEPVVDLCDLTVDPSRIPTIRAHDGVPVDTSTWTVVDYAGPATGDGVQAAIEAAAPETILRLPARTYSGSLKHRRSSVVVRGDCDDVAAVTWSHAGTPGNIVWTGPRCAGGSNDGELCWNGDSDCPGGSCDESVQGALCSSGWVQMCGADEGDIMADVYADRTAWTGGFDRHASTVTVADASAFSVGDVVWLQSDVLADPNEDVQTDSFTYIAELTALSGNDLTLDRSLPITFNSSNASVARMGRLQRHAGVECMTLESTTADDPAGLYTNINLAVTHSYDSWIRNVDFGDTFNTFAGITRSARFVVMDSRFGEQLKSLRGDGNTCDGSGAIEDNPCWNKQTVNFNKAHDNSFINNVVFASIGLEYGDSSSRNWIAYNYFPEPVHHPSGEPRRALFPHGFYGYANVMEGNAFWGVGEMDTTWGSQGPRYTWFRNAAFGPVARYSTEAWETAPDPFWLGTYANFLLNHGRDFTGSAGGAMDIRSAHLHLERNVYEGTLIIGSTTAVDTTEVGNYDASSTPLGDAWDELCFPDTLNQALTSVPSFWCSNTVSNGGPVCDFGIKSDSVGAFWDGTCKLPAQQRAEGGPCW